MKTKKTGFLLMAVLAVCVLAFSACSHTVYTLNTSAIDDLIEIAETRSQTTDVYKADSLAAVETALTAAKAAKNNAEITQEQLNSAASALLTALNAMEKKPIAEEVKPIPDEPEKLGKVSSVAVNWAHYNADSAAYPVVSFNGVEGASKYIIYVYKTDSAYAKGDSWLTYFNVPASATSAVSYELQQSTMDELTPNYFVFDVTAVGDGVYYADSDATSLNTLWGGFTYADPTIEIDTAAGFKITLSNYADYFVGTSVTIKIFDNEACTGDAVKTDTLTYTSSTNFGQTSISNSVGFSVVAADADVTAEKPLKAGVTYYVQAQVVGDGVLYNSSKAVVVSKEAVAGDYSTNQGGGGFPGGGGGGGGGGGMSISGSGSFTDGATKCEYRASFNFDLTLSAKDGCVYYMSGTDSLDGGAGGITLTVSFVEGGTLTWTANGGPFNGSTGTGTWTLADGVVSFTLK